MGYLALEQKVLSVLILMRQRVLMRHASIKSMYAWAARKLSLLRQDRLMSLFHLKQLSMSRTQTVSYVKSRGY
jgi:hypothetical protein